MKPGQFYFTKFDFILFCANARFPLTWKEKLFLHARLKDEMLRSHVTFCCTACSRLLHRDDATLEHIVPLSKGGNYEPWNLTLTCRKCNNKRGNGCDFWLWRVQRHQKSNRQPVKLLFWRP